MPALNFATHRKAGGDPSAGDAMEGIVVKFKLNGSAATIVASLIGGAFALAASLLPNFLPTKPELQITASGIAAPPPAAASISTAPAAPVIAASALAAPTIEAPAPAAPRPNFNLGTWTITASNDDDGNTWNNSTIKFTSEQATADGVEFAGFFEWRMNDRLLGREFFSGRYVAADRMMYFEGQTVQSPTGELAIGSYSCSLAADNRRLLDGNWGNTAGNLSGVLGVWTARR